MGGTKSGVQESMHEYPYSMLAVMIVLTGFLNYIMLHFNPVTFMMNLLLTRFTSMILDAPHLFMVMLFFIAIGCKDSGTAAGSSSGCNMQLHAPTVDSSRREHSTHRGSPLNRRPLPRSWPSWDWLQPYDPEFFLRAERKDKDGSRVGEIDRKSSSIRPGDSKVPDSIPGLDITIDSYVPDAAADPSKVTQRRPGPKDLPTQIDEVSQQHAQSLIRIPNSSVTGGNSKGTSAEDEHDGITIFAVDLFQPVSEGDSGRVKSHAFSSTKETVREYYVTQTGQPQHTASNSGLGKCVLNRGTCTCGGEVHHSSAQESIYHCTRGIRGSIKVSSDPEPASQASTEVNSGDPDGNAIPSCALDIDGMQGLESGASSADPQLISVGSLKEWNQVFGGGDEKFEYEFGQGQKDANEVTSPRASHVLESNPSLCTEVKKEHVRASSSSEYFHELPACTSGKEPRPGMKVMKDPDSTSFSEFESAQPDNMSKMSRFYSFKHTTMDEKGEEKVYWNVRDLRPEVLETWRRGLHCKCKPSRHHKLVQAIDGYPCTCTANASSNSVATVDDSYKPSAPPFDPVLFYEHFTADAGDSLFYKGKCTCACTCCEHFINVTDEWAPVCLFNRLDPTSPRPEALLYPSFCQG